MEFKVRAVLTKSAQISAIYWPFNVEKKKMVLLVLVLETVTTAFKKKKNKEKDCIT